jgi:hypothetical protein
MGVIVAGVVIMRWPLGDESLCGRLKAGLERTLAVFFITDGLAGYVLLQGREEKDTSACYNLGFPSRQVRGLSMAGRRGLAKACTHGAQL